MAPENEDCEIPAISREELEAFDERYNVGGGKRRRIHEPRSTRATRRNSVEPLDEATVLVEADGIRDYISGLIVDLKGARAARTRDQREIDELEAQVVAAFGDENWEEHLDEDVFGPSQLIL
jgi:hypothetical protein